MQYYKVGQKVITKKGSFWYYKLGRNYYKVGQLIYYKVGQNLLQSRASLLQSRAGITKWGNYYKVGHNKSKNCTWLKKLKKLNKLN